MKTLTQKQIENMPRVIMSIDEFIKHTARFGRKISRYNLSKLKSGEFLGVWKKKSGRYVAIFLKKIFIMPYTLKYRTTKTKDGKVREGKELLISNMRLPRGPKCF